MIPDFIPIKMKIISTRKGCRNSFKGFSWHFEIFQGLKVPQYFSNPTQLPDFTDHVTNGFWKTDEAFTQRRLAGVCPFYIRKVTKRGRLQ